MLRDKLLAYSFITHNRLEKFIIKEMIQVKEYNHQKKIIFVINKIKIIV